MVSESDMHSAETALHILNFDLSWASDMRGAGYSLVMPGGGASRAPVSYTVMRVTL